MSSAATLRAHLESSLAERLSSTLLLRERAAPVTVSTGVAALDELTGGLPRGALTEIVGPVSSGRTSVMFAAMAQATRRQEICALVDASDSFDPVCAAATGVDLNRVLWVRCDERSTVPRQKAPRDIRMGRDGILGAGLSSTAGFVCGKSLEQVLKVTDLLLQSGGFGMVVLDMGDIPPESVRRVPLTSWFRFRRAVEPTPTVLLLIEQKPNATTCASLVVRLERQSIHVRDSAAAAEMPLPIQKESPMPRKNAVAHAALLRGMRFHAEVLRSWMQRKPPRSVGTCFERRTAW